MNVKKGKLPLLVALYRKQKERKKNEKTSTDNRGIQGNSKSVQRDI